MRRARTYRNFDILLMREKVLSRTYGGELLLLHKASPRCDSHPRIHHLTVLYVLQVVALGTHCQHSHIASLRCSLCYHDLAKAEDRIWPGCEAKQYSTLKVFFESLDAMTLNARGSSNVSSLVNQLPPCWQDYQLHHADVASNSASVHVFELESRRPAFALLTELLVTVCNLCRSSHSSYDQTRV